MKWNEEKKNTEIEREKKFWVELNCLIVRLSQTHQNNISRSSLVACYTAINELSKVIKRLKYCVIFLSHLPGWNFASLVTLQPSLIETMIIVGFTLKWLLPSFNSYSKFVFALNYFQFRIYLFFSHHVSCRIFRFCFAARAELKKMKNKTIHQSSTNWKSSSTQTRIKMWDLRRDEKKMVKFLTW